MGRAAQRASRDRASTARDVAAVAVAGQQHGLVVLDARRRRRPAGEALERHRVGARRGLARRPARRAARPRGRTACGSVPVAAFTITKLSWLHRVGAATRGRAWRACACPHDWLTWKLTRRVRDRPRRRVGHRLLLRGARRVPRSTCSRSSTTTSTGRRGCRGARARRSRRARPTAFGTRRDRAPGHRRQHGRRARARAPPRRRRDLARHVGHGVRGERDADRRRDRRGRGLRRRDRPVPPARVHAQRDEGHRDAGAAGSASTSPRLDALALDGAARRGRRGGRAVLRRRAHAEPPGRDRHDHRRAHLHHARPTSRAPRSRAWCAGCSTASTR